LLQQFKSHIDANLSFLKKSKLLIAISGGMDSVVLTHLCYQLKLDTTLAHCNFNLRGEESNDDETFVIQLAEELNIEVFTQSFDTEDYAKNNKLSTQMAARELRYSWFNELAEQLHFDYILTAHHADDNLETFLINLSRGTGLEGLTGIPEINNNIARPLLLFSRKEIEDYSVINKLIYREDSSNASTKYLRNKLRHEVIPILKGINPQFLQSFNKTQKHLKASNEIIEDRIDAVSNEVIDKISSDEIHFNIASIETLSNPKTYLYELLKTYNFAEWDDVYQLLQAQSGKQILSNTHRLLKNREVLILSEINSDKSLKSIFIDNFNNPITTPIGIFNFYYVTDIENFKTNTVFIDKDTISLPLTLRKWREGDYFYPLGMTGKKKLSKYFKDEKLSLVDKENIWLLCSGDDIVWVIGKRLDDRFKISESTRHSLKIELI